MEKANMLKCTVKAAQECWNLILKGATVLTLFFLLLHPSVWFKHTFACLCKLLWILSGKLWQPHTVEEASEDSHWFQTNLSGHLLFLVPYTFPRLMSSRFRSLLSETFFFAPHVRKHWRFITREERWRREKRVWWLSLSFKTDNYVP